MSPEEENNHDFGAEIIEMAKEDQAAREKAFNEGVAWDPMIDEINTRRMKEIVMMVGWPVISRFGHEASNSAWLLVQHADHDPHFQQACLKLMQKAKPGEVRLSEMAMLEDRILANTGRPQKYGSQVFTNEFGEIVPKTIDEPETVDIRRQSMGLAPMAEYLEIFQKPRSG